MHDERPSATALLIAKSQLLLAEESAYSQIVDATRADYYRRFLEAVTNRPWHLGLMKKCWLRFIEHVSIPGIYLHYALRKRCIEQITRDFLARTRRQQIVVIAGGMDPLAEILSEQYREAAFFELDHPATQKAKRAALRDVNNVTLLSVDLTRQSIGEMLEGALSPDRPTLFIAEGITMYLSNLEIDKFFRQIRASARHEESCFVFTYMDRQASGSIRFESATWIANCWLRLKKEVFKWGIATSSLDDFLAERGYRVMNVFDTDYLIERYLPDNRRSAVLPAKGENICLAKLTS